MNEHVIPYDTQIDGETAKAYHAYTLYRDLGITRSLDKAYSEYLERRQNSGQTAAPIRAPRHWQEWSSLNDWTRRAEAYDADLEQKHRKAAEANHIEELKAFRDRRHAAAKRLNTAFEALIGRVEARVAFPDDKEGTTAALARAAASIGTAAGEAEAMWLGVDELYQRFIREEK